ncbi:hypothetical protein ILUMI_11984 [Ignelater luminosus]|uniref:Peptidase S1 domain-containing protein n=1 Tax=Ignelater luminosus TaxID=2038154 RepID=A0A8K0CZ39_IGNLU|nr:hypothetical protein ILUMI_11984 [Ignelater luminosus]
MQKLLCLTITILLSIRISFCFDVFGGKAASKFQFPFFLQLNVTHIINDHQLCCYTFGATLIRTQWILTCAWAFVEDSRVNVYKEVRKLIEQNLVTVFAGTDIRVGPDAIRNSLIEIYIHPDYTYETSFDGTVKLLNNDIAVAKLKKPYELQDYIAVIELFFSNVSNIPFTKDCEYGTVVGLGSGSLGTSNTVFSPCRLIKYIRVQSKDLNELSVHPALGSRKNVFYSEVAISHRYPLMAGSGGPYFCYNGSRAVQYGVVSSAQNITYKGNILLVTTYEAIIKYKDFILSHINVDEDTFNRSILHHSKGEYLNNSQVFVQLFRFYALLFLFYMYIYLNY